MEDALTAQIARAGHDLPGALADPPALLPGLEFYLEAFWLLDAGRQPAFAGIAAIAFTDIDSFAVMVGLTGQDRGRFHTILRRLDIEYRKFHHQKAT